MAWRHSATGVAMPHGASRGAILVAMLVAMLIAMGGAWSAWSAPGTWASLRSLDRVSGTVSVHNVRVGDTFLLGWLQVTLHYCDRSDPIEPPESIAFLEIVEDPPDGAPLRVFSGWMFASSPALNAMEHQVYDVWVLNCHDSTTPMPEENFTDDLATPRTNEAS